MQTASGNLRHDQFEPYPPKVVIDPATVDDTLMGEDQWQNSDFEDSEEEDDEDDEETDDADDKNDSLEESAVPALAEHSAATVSKDGLDPLPDNWRDDVRTKITALVKHAALREGLG